MLGHMNTSFVQKHSFALICARSSFASGESQISKKRFWRRLPSGACVSHTETSPFAYTTPDKMPALHGTNCDWPSIVFTFTYCNIGSTDEPNRPFSRSLHTSRT